MATNKSTKTHSATLVLFYHSPEFAETAQQLLDVGQIIPVKLGRHFAEPKPLAYEIDADQAQDYVTLFERLLAQQLSPTHVVYQGLVEGKAPAVYQRNGQILHHCAVALQTTRLQQAQLILLYGRSARHLQAAPEALTYLEALGGFTRRSRWWD